LYDEKGKRVTIAVHGSQIIPPGTVGNILATAGITDEELIDLLE
jgi:predicted RNA binding protein YcfA (HicA-like mRNA interferase family)